MGAVFEAVDEKTGKLAAVKIMRPEFARNREALTRFLNEARAANLIEHPSIVQVLSDGRLPDGTAFLVMEYLDGETLSQRLRRYQGPMPEVEVRRIGWQLAGALAAAHRKSIIHRDLKPGEVTTERALRDIVPRRREGAYSAMRRRARSVSVRDRRSESEAGADSYATRRGREETIGSGTACAARDRRISAMRAVWWYQAKCRSLCSYACSAIAA